MNIYDYGKIKSCIVCGNIDGNFDRLIKTVVGSLKNTQSFVSETHPKEIERIEREKRRMEQESPLSYRGFKKMPHQLLHCGYNLTKSVLIVNGCNSFGKHDLKYYHDKLENLNKVLADNGSYILFVRGSEDPKYFEDELINLSNIKTIKDYSVVKFNKFNCLCIGGCISLDRAWKIAQEKRIGRRLYWNEEKMVFKEEELLEIIDKYNIACVISSSCPTFAHPSMNSLLASPWVSKDDKLAKDLAEERTLMDKIYTRIVENGRKPYIWVYSKFKVLNQSTINDIVFSSLDSFRFFNFNETVSRYFNINFSENLGRNESILNNAFQQFLKDKSSRLSATQAIHPFNMEPVAYDGIGERDGRLDEEEQRLYNGIVERDGRLDEEEQRLEEENINIDEDNAIEGEPLFGINVPQIEAPDAHLDYLQERLEDIYNRAFEATIADQVRGRI